MSIEKRDLSSIRDIGYVTRAKRQKAVYPLRLDVTPKDYVATYDGDYGQAGIAYMLDAYARNNVTGLTESILNEIYQTYYKQYRLNNGKVDLPLYLSASSIVYALANGKPLSDSALYGLAWTIYKLPQDKAVRLLEIARAILQPSKTAKAGSKV